jgi:hypothetical protein
MRFMSRWLSIILVLGIVRSLHAESPRVELKGPPMINGREVREFVLVAPVQVGHNLPPGLPTTITYEMLPNRFKATCQDDEGVYYQSVGPFQKRAGTSPPGGLYVTKTPPVEFYPYTGDAHILRMRVSLEAALSAADLRKVHFVPVTGKK